MTIGSTARPTARVRRRMRISGSVSVGRRSLKVIRGGPVTAGAGARRRRRRGRWPCWLDARAGGGEYVGAGRAGAGIGGGGGSGAGIGRGGAAGAEVRDGGPEAERGAAGGVTGACAGRTEGGSGSGRRQRGVDRRTRGVSSREYTRRASARPAPARVGLGPPVAGANPARRADPASRDAAAVEARRPRRSGSGTGSGAGSGSGSGSGAARTGVNPLDRRGMYGRCCSSSSGSSSARRGRFTAPVSQAADTQVRDATPKPLTGTPMAPAKMVTERSR